MSKDWSKTRDHWYSKGNALKEYKQSLIEKVEGLETYKLDDDYNMPGSIMISKDDVLELLK